MLSFLGIFGGRRASLARATSARGRRVAKPRYFRPCLEGFEDRVVPAAPALNAAQVGQALAQAPLLNITGINLTNLQIVNNVLHAAGTVTGTLAGLPFTTQITDLALQLLPATPGSTACSVLHLELAPIHLNLLGLHVDTSRICLNVTATPGGGLLGNLLCGLAGGLPTLPTAGQLADLQDQLTGLFNQLLGSNAAAPAQGGQDPSVCTGQREVLDLSLGPVNLSLLGLNVSLDNCAGGPVQVCVSATPSEGLLGSLLGGLAGRPNTLFSLADVTQLINAATNLLGDGSIAGSDIGALTSLANHLKH